MVMSLQIIEEKYQFNTNWLNFVAIVSLFPTFMYAVCVLFKSLRSVECHNAQLTVCERFF